MWEDDDVNDDSGCDPEEERRRVEAMPIYQKAEEIRDLTRMIIDSIDDQTVKVIYSNTMLEDSIIIPQRIASAEAVNDYVTKMENATIIKIHARSLEAQSVSPVFYNMIPSEYLTLLRKEIKSFRELYKQWIRTFDQSEKNDDGWGLFLS